MKVGLGKILFGLARRYVARLSDEELGTIITQGRETSLIRGFAKEELKTRDEARKAPDTIRAGKCR